MRSMGLDFGSKTLGIAISDITKTIASSYKVLRYEDDYTKLFNEIKDIINSQKIDEIVLGLPKSMNNTNSIRTEETLVFSKDLSDFLNTDIFLQDERLTTRGANDVLIKADVSRKKRKTVVDKIAATLILQNYLDKKRKEKEYGRS